MIFTHTISNKEGYFLIQLKGDLIEKSLADPLLEDLDKQLNQGNLKFVIDFSQLNYLNSNGLGILIKLLTKIRNKGGELSGFELNDKIKKLLLITKLNQLFIINETLEDSIKAFSIK
jgi:anti-sigma B factor antagonist